MRIRIAGDRHASAKYGRAFFDDIRRVMTQWHRKAYTIAKVFDLPGRRKWLFFAIAVAVGGWLLHEPLLSRLTRTFRSNDTIDESELTHLYMISGDRMLETTIAMAAGQKTILMPEEWAPRSVQCGAAPPTDDLLPNLLIDVGAKPEQLQHVPGRSRDRLQKLQFLGDWLEQHPDAIVCMFADALSSGGLRRMIDRELVAATAAQIKVKPLEPTEYSADRWWRTTTGCKAFYGQAIGRFYNWMSPGGLPTVDDLSPQEYEDAFIERLQAFGVPMRPADENSLPPTEPLPSEPLPVGAS
ncbi:hypothetical protein EC9_17660 [Rosistilla ulvae]|uniref:Uncharacterized protein n=1 Tax=Rosistilla ulvae TaxID=1930277 RepID=A0A517LY84_9BACT|nr:hypothetical protein [Rosistilla ulvae]QDS87587.1 hypothetical protein EC9_17660 [Rosistilla ulvae]